MNRNPQINRVSPNRAAPNRVSPGTSGARYDMNGRRISPAAANPAKYDMNGRRISPGVGNTGYTNPHSRIYGNKGASPTGQQKNDSAERRQAGNRFSGSGKWDIYGRVRSKERSGSNNNRDQYQRNAAPKVNNFMR